MATRKDTLSTNRNSSRSEGSGSAFSWSSAGVFAGVALGGAALALAANLGRKFAVQAVSARKGNWADTLAAEHVMVLAIFDKMLATDDRQTTKRKTLLVKLGHALDKHAYAEEHVVYPALREANDRADAEELETEHGEVKTFLYRLQNMAADAPEWLETVSEFRNSVSAHARMEEDEIFPRLRSEIDEELDARITHEVNKAGFMMA
ncbi:MAG: hemerythrin domain-containing protein [Pseudomonadota bacterium]